MSNEAAQYSHAMNIHVFDSEQEEVKGADVTFISRGESICRGRTQGVANRPLKLRFNTPEPCIDIVVQYQGKSDKQTVRVETRDVTFTLSWVRISKPILFISSNPRNTLRLRIDSEQRAVQRQLDRALEEARFKFIPLPAARIDDILEALSTHRPMIVHFSGHAIRSGELLLEDESGSAKSVEPIYFFRRERRGLSCVFLNACFSRQKADEIAERVPHVVVMKREIGDRAAKCFAEGFYRGIVEGLEPPKAFQEGLASLGAHKIAERDVPMLLPCSKGEA